MQATLLRARRHRGYALARRACVQHAPEPLYQLGQDQTTRGLHGRRNERHAGSAVAERDGTGQNTRDTLHSSESSHLNSPTVFGLRQDRAERAGAG
jgi:hypothetical protein